MLQGLAPLYSAATCLLVLGSFPGVASLQNACPQLQAIAHNGGESFKHAKHSQALGVQVYRLPSSSPANATWSFERKLHAWRHVFVQAGLAVIGSQ